MKRPPELHTQFLVRMQDTKRGAAVLLLALVILFAKGQGQTVPFDSNRWKMEAKESKVVDYLGRKSLLLKGGLAVLKDSRFTNGVIEFDIAFSQERGFMGAVWRVQDFENYEEFYFRPHQSGNPDANQYQPVFNGVSAWQLYYGEDYSAPSKYDFNQWIHVKVLVLEKNAEIYIKDMDTPALFINELKRNTSAGDVGLSVGNFAPAYYSNFRVTPMSNLVLKGKAKNPATAPVGTVMSWRVSNTFEGKSLEKNYLLTSLDKEGLSWKPLQCESSGIANLARLEGLRDGKNTVFARLTIRSEREQIAKIKFGFSDIVNVYFNDRLLYRGSDAYLSRDYRFLGTVGLFDELFLPLRQGDNELWIAVTENFGGWGIKAMIDDTNGISIR